MTIAQEVMKYVVKNCEPYQHGQGVISITCQLLWDMDDKTFKEKFLLK